MEKVKYFLIYYILISFLFQIFLSIDEPMITPKESYQSFFTDKNSEINIAINTSLPNNSIYYLHLSTEPYNNQSQDLQQIIFSSETEKPSANDSNIYSYRYSRNANLITLISNETSQIYLTVKCFKYPCSFNFKAEIQKDKANLYLDETHNYYLYDSNSIGKEKFNKIKFNIPAIKKGKNNKLMVTILNPKDTDGSFSKLYSFGKITLQQVNLYKINMGVVYVVNEADDYRYYELEIESLENQFITISIKATILKSDKGGNYYESDITPNTIAKFSYLKVEGKKVNECFKINEDYISNFLDNDNNNYLYASIVFFSIPIKTYLNYSNSEFQEIDNNDFKNTLNVILPKKSNSFPLICFEQDNLIFKDNAFMLELSHMYPGMQNIDIFSPIFSGFFNTKILLTDSLGIYSHYTDVKLIKKLSFYLREIKGSPIMYLVECDNYPNCYNKIANLEKNPDKAFKAQDFGKFQISQKKYKTSTKDLSPNGLFQNLLYVYCPPNSGDYCEFQILIYSDWEEIVLNINEDFNIVSEKEDNFMFRLSLKKGEKNPTKIDFCFDASTNDINFDKLQEFNNATTITFVKGVNNMNCYRYGPDPKYNDLSQKDLDIVFNIQTLKDINFTLKNNIIYFSSNEIGEIINMQDFSFPYSTNYLIQNQNSNFFFNLYLNNKNYQGLNLAKVVIGANVINSTYASKIAKQNEIKILEGSIEGHLDQATGTCVLNINKEFIKGIIKDDNENQYYLHLVIVNNDISTNDNKNIKAKMFLLERGRNNELTIDKNIFISDNITFDNNNNNYKFNLYHIKMENKTKLEIKFSSNYPLDEQFFIYLLEYSEANIDINYIERNSKPYSNTSIGQVYTLLYENNDSNRSDVILAVVSKLDKNKINLETINYMFKYSLFSNDDEYNKRAIYEFNENYNLTKETNKYILEFDSIKKNGIILKNNEIYIRRVLVNKRISSESLATFAKIESRYELINIYKKEEGNITKLTLTNINNEKFDYSIIIDNQQENEKFILSNKTEIKIIPPDDNENEPNDDSLIFKIVIPIVVVVMILVILLIILTLKKRKGNKLSTNIMKAPFMKADSFDERLINAEET